MKMLKLILMLLFDFDKIVTLAAAAVFVVVTILVNTSNPHTTEMSSTISAEALTVVQCWSASVVSVVVVCPRIRHNCKRGIFSDPSFRV